MLNATITSTTRENRLYYESEFMHDVQLAGIYEDSKTFVDKKLKHPETIILNNYRILKENNNNAVPSKSKLIQFIDENLEDGGELEEWIPPDFIGSPSIIDRIDDENYKCWAYKLNNLWKILARKVKYDVKIHPDRYSLLWVPNGIIIPGGRFREIYYWDTYWIINGLLLCEMMNTARGMIGNIISLVNEFGFMPNGSRVYYLNRSQPPLLILMVLSYYNATKDFEYIKSIVHCLEVEFKFWTDNRMVTFSKDGKSYTMARYYAPSRGPRPESYKEDYEFGKQCVTEEEKYDLYTRIKSATESGMDFSSRWFTTPNALDEGNVSDIQTPHIVPVDLNSILQKNAEILSTWFNKMGNKTKAEKYCAIAQQFLKNIHEVMWRQDKGIWFDWNLTNHIHREHFYASNIVPLWTESYKMSKKKVADAILKYLIDQHIIKPDYTIRFKGIPTSKYITSQQWDFPNAWPPLQAFLIQGLDRTEQKLAQQVAMELTEVWLHTNYTGFAEKSVMFEKYNVLTGEIGQGGEYISQTGFGWTNGVILELLNRWGNLVSYVPPPPLLYVTQLPEKSSCCLKKAIKHS